MADELGVEPSQIDLRNEREPLRGLLEREEILLNPVTLGKRRVQQYRAVGLDQLTLSDLVRHAESCIDPDHSGKRGRAKTLDGPREVEVISERQYRRIVTVANKLASYLDPASAREGLSGHELWSQVQDTSLWIQDEGATGASEWTRMREAINKAGGAAADIGAGDLLLDLAATEGLIERTDPAERYVLPVAWAPIQERWLKATAKRGLRGRQYGLGQLLRAAAVVLGPDGDLDTLRDEAVCERVIDYLRDRLLATSDTSATQRTWIRGVVRRLIDAREIADVTIDRFDQRTHDRFRRWSSARDKEIARAHAAWDLRAMDDAWDRFPLQGLADAENPYSLRRAVEFFTCPAQYRADWRGMVLGEVNQFPRRAPRKFDQHGRLWREATTVGNITVLAYAFGVVERYTDFDLDVVDLRDVLTPGYLDLVLKAHEDGRLTTRMAHDVCVYTGMLASPWLEIVALEEGDGNPQLANRLFAYSAQASGYGTVTDKSATGFAGESLSQTLGRGGGGRNREDEDEDDIEVMRARAQHVQRAWEAATGCEWAYDGMVLAYQAAKRRVLRQIGVETLAELNERWDEMTARNRVNGSRRQELRALALWNDLLAAPMRDRATTEQTLGMRRWKGGRLILDTPGSIHKVPQNGRYRVTLWEEGSGYDLDMWQLWIERVRPALLAGKKDTDLVWVNDFTQARAKHPEISKTAEQLKKVSQLAAAELEFDHALLEGVVSGHPFRHAVASKLVAKEQLRLAADLLHHKTTEMVQAVYGDRGDQASTGAIRAAAQQEAGRAARDAELLERLKAHPELMRRLLGDEEAA